MSVDRLKPVISSVPVVPGVPPVRGRPRLQPASFPGPPVPSRPSVKKVNFSPPVKKVKFAPVPATQLLTGQFEAPCLSPLSFILTFLGE